MNTVIEQVKAELQKANDIYEVEDIRRRLDDELEAEHKELSKMFRRKGTDTSKAARIERARKARRLNDLRDFLREDEMAALVVQRSYELDENCW